MSIRSTPALIDARPRPGFRVDVSFEDGVEGTVDLSDVIGAGPMFDPLADPDFFNRLECDYQLGTIVWPNEADIAPETLYAAARSAASGQV